MGISFWIYIIIAIVVTIVRQMKKSAKNDIPPPRTTTSSDNSTGNKPLTFEELLREIQASKTPPQPAQPARPARSYDVDYDDDLEDEEKDLETIPNGEKRTFDNDSRSYEQYEKAKAEAFNRPSLEETLKLQDTVIKFGHFKEYDETSKRSIASEVLEDLGNPEGFKKAFIMSEILKRKF